MGVSSLEFTTRFPVPVEELFAWHERAGAFERLNPPWEPVTILERHGGIQDNATIKLRIPFGPFGITWSLKHRDYQHNKQFRDVQISGPFASWNHLHQFVREDNERSHLSDRISFELPFGALGTALGGGMLSSKLKRLFAYRHRTVSNDLMLHKRYGSRPLRIAISGSHGLVGTALCAFLRTGGHTVLTLVRSATTSPDKEIYWNAQRGVIEREKLEKLDAIIHLAGESIASGRWSSARKEKIRESRVTGTQFLCEQVAALKYPPKVFLAASATGYYGDRGAQVLDEYSSPGSGFLADVVQAWEQATGAVRRVGIRTVLARFGVALSANAGALQKMLPPFELGVGGVLGSGTQYMSWIALDDLIGAVYHLLAQEECTGVYNITAPNALSNLEFTKTLGAVLHRPTVLTVPSQALKILFGELADEALLASTRVAPKRLLESGYQFLFADLSAALRHTLGREEFTQKPE